MFFFVKPRALEIPVIFQPRPRKPQNSPIVCLHRMHFRHHHEGDAPHISKLHEFRSRFPAHAKWLFYTYFYGHYRHFRSMVLVARAQRKHCALLDTAENCGICSTIQCARLAWKWTFINGVLWCLRVKNFF